MTHERWNKLKNIENQTMKLFLTPKELSEGWHWCPAWDGLLISPETDDGRVCTCASHPLFQRRLRRHKILHNLKTVLVVWAVILGPYLLLCRVLGLKPWVAAVSVLAFWALVAVSVVAASWKIAGDADDRISREDHE